MMGSMDNGDEERETVRTPAADAAGGDHRDALPADLDVTGYVGPYAFPDNKRRRVPAAIYAVSGLALAAVALRAGSDAVLVNTGTLVAGIGLLLFGLYGFVTGYPLTFDETRALGAASRASGFAVGHASAQLGWRGLLSRPTWRILLYSADEPPTQRGLVLVDAVDGEVIDSFVEDNPEDWSQYQTTTTSAPTPPSSGGSGSDPVDGAR